MSRVTRDQDESRALFRSSVRESKLRATRRMNFSRLIPSSMGNTRARIRLKFVFLVDLEPWHGENSVVQSPYRTVPRSCRRLFGAGEFWAESSNTTR